MHTLKQQLRRLLYYPVATFAFLFSMSSYLLPKFCGTLSAVLIYYYFEKEWWSGIVAIVAFWVVVGLVFTVTKYLIGRGILLMEFSDRFKRSYLKEFGQDYAKPTFEEYDLPEQEYYAYNRRFQIDVDLFSILTVPIFLWYCNYKMKELKGQISIILIIFIAIAVYLVARLLLNQINKKLSIRYTQYSKVEKYKKALNIYEKVHEEIMANKESILTRQDFNLPTINHTENK